MIKNALYLRLRPVYSGAILVTLLTLTGCANFQEVVISSPSAIGTVVTTEIFGGEGGIVPEPREYAIRDIAREGRLIHNNARRNTKEAISDSITSIFKKTK